MKLKIIYFVLVCLCLCFEGYSQHHSGIFYSTLFAKEGIYLRNNDFGNNARYLFFQDVNGDGMYDGIACVSSKSGGVVQVALSDGTMLTPSSVWADLNVSDFWKVYMGDINGDKCSDLVCVDLRTSSTWVMLSDGRKFESPVLYGTLNNLNRAKFVEFEDVNGDGKDDVLWGVDVNDKLSWTVAYSLNGNFVVASALEETKNYNKILVNDLNRDGCAELVGICQSDIDILTIKDNKISFMQSSENKFDVNRDEFYLFDIDSDQYLDLIVWEASKKCDWFVKYSLGSEERNFEKWINCHLPGKSKNGVNFPDYAFCGSLNGIGGTAIVVSEGRWTGVQFTSKGVVELPDYLDKYVAGGNNYVPVGGTYDPGDSIVNDKQIRMIHDAGFTYITLDITNGEHHWVDWRAKALMDRVRIWNEQLKPGQHKMFVNVALGMTREKKDFESFIHKFASECQRAWDEFYLPYKDIYYHLNGKPLFIHMIDGKGWEMVKKLEGYKGNRKYIDQLTNRWMDGTQSGTKGRPNAYGWIVPGNDGNEYHHEMMPVMPGFWNGITFWSRNEGMQYKLQWLRVLKYKPSSVWVNSFNETWEHTSVEPSRIISRNATAHIGLKPWTDHYGNLYDNYYWDMTIQYNQLYMNNVLFEGSYFQEEGSDIIYKVTKKGFIPQTGNPVMKPVLLFLKGFREDFDGQILN